MNEAPPGRLAQLSAVWTARDRLAKRVLLPHLAEELGLSYHELYHMVRRLDLHLELYTGTREYQVTPEAAAALRAENARVRDLYRRSMKLAAASRQLKVALSTTALLVKRGDLDLDPDPETDSSGAMFVTCSSVELSTVIWISSLAATSSPQVWPWVLHGDGHGIPRVWP